MKYLRRTDAATVRERVCRSLNSVTAEGGVAGLWRKLISFISFNAFRHTLKIRLLQISNLYPMLAVVHDRRFS